MEKAPLVFASVVSPSITPGATPITSIKSTVPGAAWYAEDVKQVGTGWWVKGSSYWWPATAFKCPINGQPVVIEVPGLAGGEFSGPGFPGKGPSIKCRLPYWYTQTPGEVGYASIMNFPHDIAAI